MIRFYLGTHQPGWLSRVEVPLFVSHRRLAKYKSLPRARAVWALDSGGFTELSEFGEWRTSPVEYVAAVERYARGIGRMEWAAPQDWMCEPWILAKTGLPVEEHQRRTVANYLHLTELWAAGQAAVPIADRLPCPFRPVLQGWTLTDYERCAGFYADAGVRLADEPLVGIGSVCRRQATDEIGRIVAEFGADMRLHGFGCKIEGLARYGGWLYSADSMAWSYGGRRVPGCAPGHKNEANCLPYALGWRDRIPLVPTRPQVHQLDLFRMTNRRTA